MGMRSPWWRSRGKSGLRRLWMTQLLLATLLRMLTMWAAVGVAAAVGVVDVATMAAAVELRRIALCARSSLRDVEMPLGCLSQM